MTRERAGSTHSPRASAVFIKAARKRAAPARPRPAGDLRPASAGPAGMLTGDKTFEDLGAPP
ncbi:hypothetical protein Nm8I071_15380 [Nonomuraea sp. TT08I-71]|nr:hypothetical protein Nm8I071_15380 [Nonomuraea sp. TT08I-71]